MTFSYDKMKNSLDEVMKEITSFHEKWLGQQTENKTTLAFVLFPEVMSCGLFFIRESTIGFTGESILDGERGDVIQEAFKSVQDQMFEICWEYGLASPLCEEICRDEPRREAIEKKYQDDLADFAMETEKNFASIGSRHLIQLGTSFALFQAAFDCLREEAPDENAKIRIEVLKTSFLSEIFVVFGDINCEL